MKLLRNIKMQCLLMFSKKSFQFSFALSLGYTLVTYLYYALKNINGDIYSFYSAQSVFAGGDLTVLHPFFLSLYPFLLVFPYSFSHLTDKSIHIKDIIKGRSKASTYIISQAITSFIGGFLIICIPFLINIMLNTLTFPAEGTTFFTDVYLINYNNYLSGVACFAETNYKGIWFLDLYLKSPLLYNVMFTLLFSLVTGISSVFVYSISFFIKEIKILLLLPFYFVITILGKISVILEERVEPIVNYNIKQYLSVNALYGRSPYFFIIFYMILAIISAIFIFRQIYKEKDI